MQSHVLEEDARAAVTEEIGRLETHVRSRLNGRVHDFHLVAQADGLILRGHAHTYYAKQIAQHLVMEETKLSIRSNEIEVF